MVNKRIAKKRMVSKKENRLKKVLTACGKSIEHWEDDILEDSDKATSANCALCQLQMKDEQIMCSECIIHELTDTTCDNTGYDIMSSLESLLGNLEASGISITILKDIKTTAIITEINFLKALKALTAERLKNERLGSKIKMLT